MKNLNFNTLLLSLMVPAMVYFNLQMIDLRQSVAIIKQRMVDSKLFTPFAESNQTKTHTMKKSDLKNLINGINTNQFDASNNTRIQSILHAFADMLPDDKTAPTTAAVAAKAPAPVNHEPSLFFQAEDGSVSAAVVTYAHNPQLVNLIAKDTAGNYTIVRTSVTVAPEATAQPGQAFYA